jgi:hypothetical protein
MLGGHSVRVDGTVVNTSGNLDTAGVDEHGSNGQQHLAIGFTQGKQ